MALVNTESREKKIQHTPSVIPQDCSFSSCWSALLSGAEGEMCFFFTGRSVLFNHKTTTVCVCVCVCNLFLNDCQWLDNSLASCWDFFGLRMHFPLHFCCSHTRCCVETPHSQTHIICRCQNWELPLLLPLPEPFSLMALQAQPTDCWKWRIEINLTWKIYLDLKKGVFLLIMHRTTDSLQSKASPYKYDR